MKKSNKNTSNILSLCSSFANIDQEKSSLIAASKRRPASAFNSYRQSQKALIKPKRITPALCSRRSSNAKNEISNQEDYLPLRSKRDTSLTSSSIEPTKMQPAILKKPFNASTLAQQRSVLDHIMWLKQSQGLDFLQKNKFQ